MSSGLESGECQWRVQGWSLRYLSKESVVLDKAGSTIQSNKLDFAPLNPGPEPQPFWAKHLLVFRGVVPQILGVSVIRICNGDLEPASHLTPLSLRFSISTWVPHLELPTSGPEKFPVRVKGLPGSWYLAHTQKWTVVYTKTSPRMQLWARPQAKRDGASTKAFPDNRKRHEG